MAHQLNPTTHADRTGDLRGPRSEPSQVRLPSAVELSAASFAGSAPGSTTDHDMDHHRYVVELTGIRFRWSRTADDCLDIESLRMAHGESVFIHGPSGSGKSTLLSLLAGVHAPAAGELRVLGCDIGRMSLVQRDRFRADHIGYIFQQFNLLPYVSVMANVLLPCKLSRVRRQRANAAGGPVEQARELLSRLDIGPGLREREAAALSVGQQQRVAAARALIGQPQLVIADEPTSALDAGRREAFMELLLRACGAAGASLVFVSHDTALSKRFDRSCDLSALNRASAKDLG